MAVVSIGVEKVEQEAVRGLFAEADRWSAALYPGEDRVGLGVERLVALGVVLFVARAEGMAVGCGGFVPGGDGVAELKRMFVREAARGRGVGAAMLGRIEAAALGGGMREMRLETGRRAVAALGLYRRFGYRERAPFGEYAGDPLSVFMEKRLGGS